MNYFKFDQIKLEGEGVNDGRKVLYVDILPQKSCIYNCVICARPKFNQGSSCDFGDIEDSLQSLSEKIELEKPDMVYLYGQGDPITNDKIELIINRVHEHGLPVRVIVNGPMLGSLYHMREANLCDEVVGCLAFIKEDDFQKIHHPMEGLSCAEKIESLVSFSQQYKGKFTLRVVVLKGFYDTDEQLAELKSVVDRIKFDDLSVCTRPTGKMGDALAVSEERLDEIHKFLNS